MSSHSINTTSLFSLRRSSFNPQTPPLSFSYFPSAGRFSGKQQLRCSAVLKPVLGEYANVLQMGLPVIKLDDIAVEELLDQALKEKKLNQIRERVTKAKAILSSMEDGNITISAYDTAWVALIEDINGGGGPQFPSCLDWIANNQLSDGSWGDEALFLAHDRLVNTLACVVALKTWNIHQDKCDKGLSFVNENISKLANENDVHMPIGFEVVFPQLIELARRLGLQIPYDCPVLQGIYEKRDLKLKKIPKALLHQVPTTLLHSLEGITDLDWEKLLKFQFDDGSFLFSPSSTAFAHMQTKNDKCLDYLTKIVNKFNGGAPNVYPVDMFEHIWTVDRIQRLGISRYFTQEIKDCMDYIHQYWRDEEGICWARNTRVQDMDDTAMGFRLLRLHGYEVSADVFKNFRTEDGEFFGFLGQSTEAVTGIYNLYRASQIAFPGETILHSANEFSSKILREKQAANQLLDKWIIIKDLPGEVRFALDVPWYANLPRVETRLYIEQYGGKDDVWIGKTLYRMPTVNNNDYLDLAKLDFNFCQSLHQIELNTMLKWYTDYQLGKFGATKRTLLVSYFLAAASIFEPEREHERLAWAQTAVLMETIVGYYKRKCKKLDHESAMNKRAALFGAFSRGWELEKVHLSHHELAKILFDTINNLALDTIVDRGKDITPHLYRAWQKWLMKWQIKGDKHGGEAELLVQTVNLASGFVASKYDDFFPEYTRLMQLTNAISHRLLAKSRTRKVSCFDGHINGIKTFSFDADMEEFVQSVLQNGSNEIYSDAKQTFLAVIKSFYYIICCRPGMVNFHISRVLFEKVY